MTISISRGQLPGVSQGQFGGNLIQKRLFSTRPTIAMLTRADEKPCRTSLWPLYTAGAGVLRRPKK